VLITPVTTPPSFYHFAKTEENVREAVGIAAVYFSYKSEHPGSRADVTSYKWEDGKLLVQVAEDGHPLLGFAVQFSENLSAVGRIQRAVVVDGVRPAENIEAGERCPSIENAYLSGWFYSPDMVLDHLRSRTWWRSADNLMISVPADASVSAAAVTTNVSTYPTWRVTFDNQVIFYRAMPWWELENVPGFLFQSDPELHPVI
jgi:hypothetical protein